MYFHMTLSYVGQLLDELSILWTLAVAYSFWLPKTYFPRCIKSRYDPEGRWVAGYERKAGTMTLVRVTYRSLPKSPASSRLRALADPLSSHILPISIFCSPKSTSNQPGGSNRLSPSATHSSPDTWDSVNTAIPQSWKSGQNNFAALNR